MALTKDQAFPTPRLVLSSDRDVTSYVQESITSIQECLAEIGLISPHTQKNANTIISSVSEA